MEEIGRYEWFGGIRTDLSLDPHAGFVLLSKAGLATERRAWVWYAPTFTGRLPGQRHAWIIERLLGAGIALAGVDVGESYGSPAGRQAFSRFYEAVTEQFGLSRRVALLGQSRGALMAYNWAAERPECVAGIAGIYPVCDLACWPGVETACKAYGLSPEELRSRLPEHNPIDRLAPLAAADIPVFHIHGDVDQLIPLDRHSGVVAERYRALGGCMDLEVVPGKGHEEVDEFFTSLPLTEFLKRVSRE
jgi:pimeloyl-ACP methyl ester carboxylesterase